MYELRDNYMIKFELGQWYITYYYTLAKVAQENNMINSETYMDYLSFGSALLNASDILRDGSGEEIVITQELKNTAMTFVSRFRAITNDDLTQQYLNNIERDLDKYTGKTASELRTTLRLQ